jgi:hypothetical protein
MSRSVHITRKNFRGLTKSEIKEQAIDPTSELKQWAKKAAIKKTVNKQRKMKNDN